jgi:hypothetical protein
MKESAEPDDEANALRTRLIVNAGREMQSFRQRWVLLVPLIVLGYFIVSLAWQWRADYWVLADGRPGMALVTGMSWAGHGVVDYEYEVDGTRFTGRGQRNWSEEKYRNVRPGNKSVVYFSASHPWLSALDRPKALATGWPVVLVALPVALFLLTTVMNPRSKRASDTSTEKAKNLR